MRRGMVHTCGCMYSVVTMVVAHSWCSGVSGRNGARIWLVVRGMDMSQRNSGYERKERDLYETPEWVTECLLPHIPDYVTRIWEPACGSGKMARVLAKHCRVTGSDISQGPSHDFLMTWAEHDNVRPQAIITNPPYNLAQEFIENALRLKRYGGFVAMLLRTDYDHAKTRRHLFADNPAFAKKIVLTKRIVWFEGGKSPSFNHAWFIWDWEHDGPPTLAYAP